MGSQLKDLFEAVVFMADLSVDAADDSPPIFIHLASNASEKRQALTTVWQRGRPRLRVRRLSQAGPEGRILAAVEKDGAATAASA